MDGLSKAFENAITPEGHADINANARALVEEWLNSPVEVYIREKEARAKEVERARARAELDECCHQIAAERFGFKRFSQDFTAINSGVMNYLIKREIVQREAQMAAEYLSTPKGNSK